MEDAEQLKAAVRQSVVRIQNSDGAIIGTGILLSPTRVLTCDHVLTGVDGSAGELALRCAFLERDNDLRRVIETRRLPPSNIDPGGKLDHRRDVAVLVLEEPFTVVPRPLPWSESASGGSARVAFAGFRQRGMAGGSLEWAMTTRGDFDASRGCYMLQDASTTGFSGGPVVQAGTDGPCMIGMIVANLRESPQRAWFLPSQAIAGALRALGEPALPRASAPLAGDALGGIADYRGFLESLRIKHGLDRSFIDLSASVLLPGRQHVSSLTDRIVGVIKAERPTQLRMFVLGHYGAGKSSVAVESAIRALLHYEDSTGESARLPIYLRLRDWKTMPSWANIQAYLGQSPNYPFRSVEHVERLASQDRLFFLLDGLDEMSQRLSRRESIALVNGIPRSLYPGASFVAFSRLSFFLDVDQMLEMFDEGTFSLPSDLTQRLSEWNYQALSLDPPSEEQIKKYVDDACGLEASRVARILEETYNLSDLARRPVLLKMTIDCLPLLEARIGTDDRVEAADLYAMYVQQWLHRTHEATHVSIKERLSIIQELALLLWGRRPQRIRSAELSEFLAQKFPEHRVDELLFDIANCSMLDLGDEGYEFSHKSFLEYFIARAVVDDLFHQNILEAPSLISQCLTGASSHNEVVDFARTLVLRRLADKPIGLTRLLANLESKYPIDRRTVGYFLGHVAAAYADSTLCDRLVMAYNAETEVLAKRSLAVACGRAGRNEVMIDYMRDVLPGEEPRLQNLGYHLEYYGTIQQTLVALISHLLSDKYEFIRDLDLFTLRQIVNNEKPMTSRQQAFSRAALADLRGAASDEELLEYIQVRGRQLQRRIATTREAS